MNARARRIATSAVALMVSLACAAGCHGLRRQRQAGPASALLGGDDRSPAITAAGRADVQFAFGRAAEQRGDVEQAMVAYRETLARDGKRADAAQRLAVLHDRRGQFKESAELYRRALKARPDDPEILCDRGYSLYLQRRWADAERDFRRAVALDPKLARAHNNLGLVLARAGHPDEAAAAFRLGGADDAQARQDVAFALAAEGRLDEARDQYRLALKAAPASAEARAHLGELESVMARLDRPAAGPAARRDDALMRTSGPAPRPDSPRRVR